MSLTAHWLTHQFERKSAILHAQPFDGSHTGEAICQTILKMLQSWHLSKDKVHLVIRDNAANMIKGITDGGLQNLGCFAHTLQLVINDGVLLQRIVIDMLATSMTIVGHFRCSTLAYSRLRNIQENLGLPIHRLIQDEPTRWNSTLQRLIFFGRETSLVWWANNMKRFPYLAKIVLKYLSAPPTSVPPERLFSGAGNIYDEKRNRLAPEKAEMLLFIKNNFKLC